MLQGRGPVICTGKTFDDFLFAPAFGVVETRESINLTSPLMNNLNLQLPIISANMDTITGVSMAVAMAKEGAIGAIHRAESIIVRVAETRTVEWAGYPVTAAVGVTGWYRDEAYALWRAGASAILIDIAHGHSIMMEKAIREIRKELPSVRLIAGNVATYDGARFLRDLGVDAIKVGIGAGSVCRTRLETGIGVPQFQAICEAYRAVGKGIPIIADGGIRNDKDIFMSFVAGASTVMLGGMLAGTDEAAGGNTYRGMASQSAQEARGEFKNAPEGMLIDVPSKGPVSTVLKRIAGHLRSSISYAGFSSLKELSDTVPSNLSDFLIPISDATRKESFAR